MDAKNEGKKDLLHVSAKYYYWKLAMAYWSVYELEAYRRFVSFPESSRILDVGCGDGVFGRMVTDVLGLDNKFIGVDVDKKSILKANNRMIYEEAYCCDSSSMPFDRNEFRSAISNQVLHCVDGGPSEVLNEVNRVLKKDGLFVCTTLTDRAMFDLYVVEKLKRAGLNRLSNFYKERMVQRLPAISCLGVDEWCKEIENSGMSVIKVVPFMYGNRYKLWSIFMMIPFRFMGVLRLNNSDMVKRRLIDIIELLLGEFINDNIYLDNSRYGDSILIIARNS